MANCKEYNLDDMVAITAIPVRDIPADGVGSPVNSLTPTIGKADFHPTLEHAITIGRKLLDLSVAGGTVNRSAYLVPIKRDSGKVKDDSSDSVSGRLHTVTVHCEVDERGGEIWAPTGQNQPPCCMQLERTAHHLVLTFRDCTMGFVAASEDTYLCTVDRDGAKVSVQFRVQDLMGVQLVV